MVENITKILRNVNSFKNLDIKLHLFYRTVYSFFFSRLVFIFYLEINSLYKYLIKMMY